MRGQNAEVVALGLAYVVTAGYLVWRATGVHSYVWLIDEFLYTKGALGFADGHLTGHVFGAPQSVHAPLYSWMLAPIYGLFDSQRAFKAAHGVDALVFAATMVPVYLTARYLGARQLVALLAGLLAVWIPWAAATLVLMSESLAYFTFAWAVLAMVRAIAEPSPGRDALALVAIAATAYTRPQFTLLFAIFVAAVALFELAADDTRPVRDRLQPHWVLGAAAAVGLIVVAIAGRSLLGGYSNTAGLPRFPPGLWQNMLSHAAHIVVGAGLIPAIVWLGWILRTTARGPTRRELAFAVLSALLVVFTFYEVGFFSQNVVGGRIQERTAFYVVPLFALGLAALSADGRVRGPRLSMIGAGVAVALVIGAAAFDPGEAGGVFEAIANPGASYNVHLQQAVSDVTRTFLGHALPTAEGLALLAIALGGAITVAAMPRFRARGIPILAAIALVFCLRESTTVLAHDVPGLNSAIPTALGTPNPPRGWVDAALDAPGGEAGALESPLFGAAGSTIWLWVEFWNKSITRIYTASGKDAYSDLPALPFAVDPTTGAVRTPHQKPYLVVSANDPRFELQGTVVRHGAWGIDLVKPVLPYRAAWTFVNGTPMDDLAGTAPAHGQQLQLAVFRPAGAAAGTSVPLDVRLTLAHAARTTTPVLIDDGRHETPVRLRPGDDTSDVRVRATIAPGAQRALVTFSADKAAKFAVRDVVVRKLP